MTIRTRLTAGAGALALALSLAACGPDAATSGAPASDAQSSGPRAAEVDAEHGDADVEFAQLMIEHHRGAVEMAELAAERAEGADVRELAEGIAAAQGPEIETMTSWLSAWGEPVTAGAEGGEHGADHGGMDMGGADQDAVMAELRELSGADLDRAFLERMIQHHEGAVEMARAQLADGSDPQALELAQTIIDDQTAEIVEMERMLDAL